MKVKLRTIRSFSAQDWMLLVQAWSLLLAVDIALRTLPFRKVQGWMYSTNENEIPAEQAERIIRRSSDLVDLAARRHLYPMTCLRRSLVKQFLLSRRGVNTGLHIGVRRNQEKLDAHAWLEFQGQPIGEKDPPSSQYTPLADETINLRDKPAL
jgi:Transglutaminase-like superfamily